MHGKVGCKHNLLLALGKGHMCVLRKGTKLTGSNAKAGERETQTGQGGREVKVARRQGATKKQRSGNKKD